MKLSIILPVYNVATFIGPCLTSVFDQLAEVDAEVILVDDCCTDDSIARAQEVIGQRENCHILRHDRNRGLSAARNTGMASATGDYVIFVDSDDVLAEGCLATLISLGEAHPDADVVVGQFDEFEEEGVSRPAKWKQHGSIWQSNALEAYLDCQIPVTAWNKLCRASFLKDNRLTFEEGLVHEDALWSFQVACCAHKVVVADAVTYHYRQRRGSLDKQKDASLHLEHYAKVNALQTRFVFSRGLHDNRMIFSYIEKNRFQLLADAIKLDDAVFAQMYAMFVAVPNWSFGQRTRFIGLGLKRWMRNLHWSLPPRLGQILFRTMTSLAIK